MADGGAAKSGLPGSVDATRELLASGRYVAGRGLATSVFLALSLSRPLLLEGEAGVGKTEVARVLAKALARDLIHLQCYEGLDVASAVYEWDYARQMIEIRVAEAAGVDSREELGQSIYRPEFLIRRPLLRALEPHERGAPVLLIDELDRADEPFEAFLLEVLADFRISVPELGTVHADEPPIVVLTSNRTREIHDALRRRCFYHWVDYPNADDECEILRLKAPEAGDDLRAQVIASVRALRDMDLFKAPGVAETIDWAQALVQIDAVRLTPELFDDTLGALLKYQDDIARVRGSEAARILGEVQAALGG